ncbi:MAG: 5-amino-6-(D-ribitylamino)uracil--L-tyrosine 4-hydroxyphenyl transferase CofH [Rhodomicrobium sp.]|nr:5-amino-6-(D-ribitylamino)uracil--L-tyrosine 4-hydroxyphenyl transferase CofH [Rhodomicrobium sp.]
MRAGDDLSKKVFIPLTKLCRDVCHYCTFAKPPRAGEAAYLPLEAVLEIAEAGRAAGCKEALFTLGDKPELRYAAAREALAGLGCGTTFDYLERTAGEVLRKTGLLPHLNAGVMDEATAARLRRVSVSQGLMLETASSRLCEKGMPHHGSPDKAPEARLEALRAAGRARVPMTTGLLIGIGETRLERLEALLAIRELHAEFGHIQEVIIQNFRAKPGTRMAGVPEPELDDHIWTIAMARLLLPPEIGLQAPPNLRAGEIEPLIRSGINDWGGVSPVTIDHVNPEAPWPQIDALAEACEREGRVLAERLAVYPHQLAAADVWLDPHVRPYVLKHLGSDGLAREDDWVPGDPRCVPPAGLLPIKRTGPARTQPLSAHDVLMKAERGSPLDERDIVRLFAARGSAYRETCAFADELRRRTNGEAVSYVVNRNINYTNICTYGCRFCAFSKGRLSAGYRDAPYDLPLDEIAERTRDAARRGATEVCLQGGIAPHYTGHTYLAILRAVKSAAPGIHVHAFSPLEIWHGAETLGLPLGTYLAMLKDEGLGSLPGTAAEILDDEVRAILCPDKIDTEQWLAVMRAAHGVGLPSTATIMFGHVDAPRHWARHLLHIRALQEETGGFTEFVPLPFVAMEAPISLKGAARPGPTFREAVLMHAVARIVLHPAIGNVQASWVKMGPEGAAACLDAGANDLGGVLMNESITRAAGAGFGQEFTAAEMEALIRRAGRTPQQRTTLYAAFSESLNTSAA